jgi:hypothetical protein
MSPTKVLKEEKQIHRDLVFRHECPLMKKYPENLHYGVRFPLKHLNTTDLRLRLYKVEWKISFMKWIYESRKGSFPDYLVFIEVLNLFFVSLTHKMDS